MLFPDSSVFFGIVMATINRPIAGAFVSILKCQWLNRFH